MSSRVTTDTNGNIVGQQGHYPFGESWYLTNTTTKWQFTSYERDSESGNDYAMARYDVNRLGRFGSPDHLAGSFTDPQSLNGYAYVLNDPANRIDPLGLYWQRWSVSSGGATTSGEDWYPDTTYFDYASMLVLHPYLTVKQSDDMSGPPIPLFILALHNPYKNAPPPSNHRECVGPATFSSVGPGQAPSGGALAPFGVPGHVSGGVAVSPTAFGLAFPEASPGQPLTQAQMGQRVAAQRTLAAAASQTQINPVGLNLSHGGPAPPYAISDIGDIHIRSDSGARFDIYGFTTLQSALQFGIQTVWTTMGIPGSLNCPPGMIEF